MRLQTTEELTSKFEIICIEPSKSESKEKKLKGREKISRNYEMISESTPSVSLDTTRRRGLELKKCWEVIVYRNFSTDSKSEIPGNSEFQAGQVSPIPKVYAYILSRNQRQRKFGKKSEEIEVRNRNSIGNRNKE